MLCLQKTVESFDAEITISLGRQPTVLAFKIAEELSYAWQENLDSIGYVELERTVRGKENRSD